MMIPGDIKSHFSDGKTGPGGVCGIPANPLSSLVLLTQPAPIT